MTFGEKLKTLRVREEYSQEQLAALLQKGGVRSDIRYVGTVIGSHTGPGVLAVFFFGGERRPN